MENKIMPPNWERFQGIVSEMIDTTMGAETCTITIPGAITYDYVDGEKETTGTTTQIQSALIPTNKDDLQNLPEGFREKAIRKIFTKVPLDKTTTITSDFDAENYEVIVPSASYQAGGLTICYRTFLGRVENE